MRLARLTPAALLLLAAGCQHLREQVDPRSLTSAPCDPRYMGALLGSKETLTPEEVRYLERCGVRFAVAE